MGLAPKMSPNQPRGQMLRRFPEPSAKLYQPLNPLPLPGNSRFQKVGSCLGVLARISSINFRFQGLTCGFFECIPENRAPTAPHVGDRP
eukprot:scaffold20093_cov63-Phaeocystis_antarctica.AAC.1